MPAGHVFEHSLRLIKTRYRPCLLAIHMYVFGRDAAMSTGHVFVLANQSRYRPSPLIATSSMPSDHVFEQVCRLLTTYQVLFIGKISGHVILKIFMHSTVKHGL
jgi:hypothetical protein